MRLSPQQPSGISGILDAYWLHSLVYNCVARSACLNGYTEKGIFRVLWSPSWGFFSNKFGGHLENSREVDGMKEASPVSWEIYNICL